MTPPPQEDAAQQQIKAIRKKVTKLCQELDDEKDKSKKFREASGRRDRISQSRVLYRMVLPKTSYFDPKTL